MTTLLTAAAQAATPIGAAAPHPPSKQGGRTLERYLQDESVKQRVTQYFCSRRPRYDADDLFQRVALVVLNRPDYRGYCPARPSEAIHILLNIASKKIHEADRASNRDRCDPSVDLQAMPDGASAPESALVNREALDEILELLPQLTPDQSEAVILRYLKGVPVKQIAKRLGITPTAFRSRLTRALKDLRRRLGFSGSANHRPPHRL